MTVTKADLFHSAVSFCATFMQAYLNMSDLEEKFPDLRGTLGTIAMIEMVQMQNPALAIYDPDMFIRELERKGYEIV